MQNAQTPSWLRFLERRMNWLAIPNIAVILVTLQAIGFLFVMMDPIWLSRFALFPEMVHAGEYWRLVTFLALPLSMSPIWVIFSLWFLYFVVNSIETEWGSFQTTLYVLISILFTIIFSFTFDYPVTQISGFESTLILAAATLFPEMEIQLFMLVPVKMKWLAWFTGAWVLYQFGMSGWTERVYFLAIYLNYLLFFSPAVVYRLKQMNRKRSFQRKMKND